MPGQFRFLRDGLAEIGRKTKRIRLRSRLSRLERQRQEALARLGRRAWGAQIDLTAFPDLLQQLQRLDERAGELAATTRKLEGERSALQSQRAAEVPRFDGLCQPVLKKKAEADARLRAARMKLEESDRFITGLEARLNQLTADLRRAEQVPSPERPIGQVHAEHQTVTEQLAAARGARKFPLSEVNVFTAESRTAADELARIEAERRAVLAPIEARLRSIQDESRGATQESSSVGREQTESFRQLGAVLYGRKEAHPELADCSQAVAAIDTSRADSQAALDGSLALTRAMPGLTMIKFSAVLVLMLLLLALIVGVGWLLSVRSNEYPPFGNRPFSRSTDTRSSGPVNAEESRKDTIVRAFLESPKEESKRKEALQILETDVLTLGSTADRAHVPSLVKIVRAGDPELRAAAAHSLGMIGPAASEGSVLVEALNDPVRPVRRAALGALEQMRDDPATRLLVRRVRAAASNSSARPGEERFKPEPVPDSRSLGVAIYPRATFLHYASDLQTGRAVFASPDSAQKVLDYYVSGARRPALNAEEFTRVYLGGSPGDPTGAKRLSAELEVWFAEAVKSGKSESEIRSEADRRGGQMLNLPMVRYEDSELYGAPTFVALEEATSGGVKRAVRYLVVFQDHALGRTGFEVHVARD